MQNRTSFPNLKGAGPRGLCALVIVGEKEGGEKGEGNSTSGVSRRFPKKSSQTSEKGVCMTFMEGKS